MPFLNRWYRVAHRVSMEVRVVESRSWYGLLVASITSSCSTQSALEDEQHIGVNEHAD